MSKKDELYKSYFNITSITDLIKKQREISFNDLLDKIKYEKALMANLINKTIDTDNVVEFSDACYTDGGIIVPTISQSLVDNGKNVKLLSPNLKNSNIGRLSTVNTSKSYPYGNYSLVTPTNMNKIQEVGLFITEKDFPNIIRQFNLFAGINVPCIYAMTGQIQDTVKKYDELRKVFERATNKNSLTYEGFIECEDDVATAAYVIKRK